MIFKFNFPFCEVYIIGSIRLGCQYQLQQNQKSFIHSPFFVEKLLLAKAVPHNIHQKSQK